LKEKSKSKNKTQNASSLVTDASSVAANFTVAISLIQEDEQYRE
jgi:hypothetical protein